MQFALFHRPARTVLAKRACACDVQKPRPIRRRKANVVRLGLSCKIVNPNFAECTFHATWWISLSAHAPAYWQHPERRGGDDLQPVFGCR